MSVDIIVALFRGKRIIGCTFAHEETIVIFLPFDGRSVFARNYSQKDVDKVSQCNTAIWIMIYPLFIENQFLRFPQRLLQMKRNAAERAN